MFERGFDGLRFQSHDKERKHPIYDHRISRNERKQSDEALLATGIKIKRAYYQDRYGILTVPEPLVADKGVKQELELAPAKNYSISFR